MNKFKWYEAGFRIQYENLKDYFETNEKCLDREFKDFSSQLEKAVAGLSGRERQEAYEYYIDDIWKFTEVLPTFHRTSFFLLLYNFLENQLFELGEECFNNMNLTISQKDLKGLGIERSRLFFTKVLKINTPFENHKWERLSFYNKLRNVIVHRSGFIHPEKDKDITSQFAKYLGIKLSGTSELMFDELFIKNFLTDVDALFKGILFELKKCVITNNYS